MSSKRQRLQGTHIFSNEEDCSFDTPQLENEAPSYSFGVPSQSSRFNPNYNPFPANSRSFQLYHGEASSSNASPSPQNQHNHCLPSITSNQSCTSNSSSLLFVQDHVASESTSYNHDLRSSINNHQTTGQASYQRKRGSSFNIYYTYF